MNIDSFTGSLARRVEGRPADRDRWGAKSHDVLSMSLIGLWVLIALGLLYRIPQPLQIDLGSSFGRAYVRGFEAPERNEQYSYAFSHARAQMFVPAAGGGTFNSVVRFNGERPAEAEPARVSLGSAAALVTFLPATTDRFYHVLLPASSGDLSMQVVTNPFRAGPNDPRMLGIPIDSLTVQGTAGALPTRASLLILLVGLGWYALARRLAFTPMLAVLFVLALLSSLLYGMFSARLLITVGLVRFVVVLFGLHLTLWPLRAGARAIYERLGTPLAPIEEVWLWRIFAAATLVKLSGMLYPHVIIFDQAAHVLRMQWLLEGRFMELYQPGYTSYMGDTVGLGSGQFPYSPLWYLLVTPFHFLGLGLPDATNGLSALMDVSKLFPIHLIARVTLDSRRGALYAAGLYHLIPMPYFLLSWGNYPTQFGLWATLLATAFLVVCYKRFSSRRAFWLWTALMVLAILSYTVLGVFAITFFGLLGLLGLLQRDGLGPQRLRFIVGGIIAAELFCLVIYHVQFAGPLLRDTLPALLSGTAERIDAPLDPNAEARVNALANFMANNQFTVNHFTILTLGLAVVGGGMLARDPHTRRWWPLWLAWLAIFVLYSLVSAYVADMVLKHVFFIMPLIVIAVATVLDRWWRHSVVGRVAVVGVLLFLAIEVAERGHHYLLVKRHFA